MPKIYLDSADIARIEAVKRTGVISGVTTNPVLIRTYLDEQKLGFSDYLSQLLHITQDLQLFIQPVAPNHKKFVTEARRFYEQYGEGRKIVIKVPLRISGSNRFYEGLIAINQLAQQGIEVNASAIVTPEQAVLASRAGASYVALFTGNLDDFIRQQTGIKFEKEDYFGKETAQKMGAGSFIPSCGEELVNLTIEAFERLEISSKIVIAGIRNNRAFLNYLEKDAEILTVPPRVLEKMLKHPKTIEFGECSTKSQAWFKNGK